MSQDMNGVFEFGRFRLDLAQAYVPRGPESSISQPKAVNTLAVLVRERGRIVDKDALIQEVWPNTFVEENSLTRNISVLRRVLGSQASGEPLIETVARRGYRLAVPVTEVMPAADPPAASPTSGADDAGEWAGAPGSSGRAIQDPLDAPGRCGPSRS